MAGIREWMRSRSKSRSRNSQEIRKDVKAAQVEDSQSAPPVPQAPPPVPTTSAPLPLLRADSAYRRKKEEQQAHSQTSSGDANGYWDRSQSSQQAPREPLSPGSYDSINAGEAPRTGTYPLPGNGDSRPPSEYRAASKSPSRASRSWSIGSSTRRRFSGAPASTNNRQSLPPGTAVTTDSPAVPASSGYREPPSAQRQPVSNIVTGMYGQDQGQRSVPTSNSTNGAGKTPAVPTIPGQYRPQSGSMSASQGTSHERVVSSGSRVSTSSRTPIAEEFASGSYYTRNDSPAAPTWSPVRDDSESMDNRPSNHDSKHRPDMSNMSNEVNGERQVEPPPRNSSLMQDSPSRGRTTIPRRSLEKPLPVPRELQDAPWNRQSAIPIGEPLNFGGNRDMPTEDRVGTQDRQMDGLTDQMQPLSVQDRSYASNGTQQLSGGQSGTIRDVSELSPVPGEFPLETPESQYDDSIGATPYFETSNNHSINPFVQSEVKSGSAGITDKSLAVKNSAVSPQLKNVVDLSNTEDTSVHTRNAPVVTHETIHSNVHHVREEHITRDIHTHDIYHRILPITDVQVLPARHFVPTSWIAEDSPHHPNNAEKDHSTLPNTGPLTGPNDSSRFPLDTSKGFAEVPHDFLPERTTDRFTNKNWLIAETASKLQQGSDAQAEPYWRNFTAKSFPGTKGDYREEVGSDGVRRSETTWVHMPTHDYMMKDQGLTQPLMMDDGERCLHRPLGS